jgi:hypothetical protein
MKRGRGRPPPTVRASVERAVLCSKILGFVEFGRSRGKTYEEMISLAAADLEMSRRTVERCYARILRARGVEVKRRGKRQ